MATAVQVPILGFEPPAAISIVGLPCIGTRGLYGPQIFAELEARRIPMDGKGIRPLLKTSSFEPTSGVGYQTVLVDGARVGLKVRTTEVVTRNADHDGAVVVPFEFAANLILDEGVQTALLEHGFKLYPILTKYSATGRRGLESFLGYSLAEDGLYKLITFLDYPGRLWADRTAFILAASPARVAGMLSAKSTTDLALVA